MVEARIASGISMGRANVDVMNSKWNYVNYKKADIKKACCTEFNQLK